MPTTNNLDLHLLAGVRHLAAVCDHANQDDGAGYSAADVAVGHALAAMPESSWTDDHLTVATALCHKYRRQLHAAGIDTTTAYPVDVSPRMRARVEASGREYAEAQQRRAILVGDDVIELAFPYNKEILEDLRKTVPSQMRRWQNETKQWLVQADAVRAVRQLATKWNFHLDPAIAALPDKDLPEIVADPEGVTIGYADDVFTIMFPYDADVLAGVKVLPGRYYVPDRKAWIVPIGSAAELAMFAERFGANMDEAARNMLDAHLTSHTRNVEASKTAEAVAIHVPNLADGVELLPFQSSGVAYATEAGRCIIGDDMGLGKTIQALCVLEIRHAYPAIVVCPATLKHNWAREIEKFFPHRTVDIVTGTTPRDDYRTADVTIINYDILAAHAGLKKAKNKPSGDVNVFTRGVGGLVFDEAHRLKERTSQRTKAALAVADAMPDDAVVLCLTGTPFKNRHAEIWPLLEIVGQAETFGSWTAFAKRYCAMQQRNFGGRIVWDASGSTRGEELNDRMRGGGFYVRRAKRDVLTELEPKRRIPMIVEGDPKVMAEYRKAEADLVDYLQDVARRIMDELGPDAGKDAWQRAMRAASVEHLVKVGYCKRLATKAKLPAAIDWIDTFLDADPDAKLLVFAHHLDAIDALVSKYKCPKIVGGVPNDERMRIVDRFQTDPNVRVLVLGITAAGEGLTLTQAHDVLFLEQGWTEAEQAQCEDRAYGRVSDLHSINAYYMLCDDTIDARIYSLIESKGAMAKTAADGTGAAASHTSVAGDLLTSLTRS